MTTVELPDDTWGTVRHALLMEYNRLRKLSQTGLPQEAALDAQRAEMAACALADIQAQTLDTNAILNRFRIANVLD
jgi:hypothetical protein